MLERVKRWIGRLGERRPRYIYREWLRLELTEAGFRALDTRDAGEDGEATLQHEVTWADVRAVRTFKRDLFAYDAICVAFQMVGDDDGDWVEIDETNPGFDDVTGRMRERFPTVPDGWYSDVMLPPFATNDALLYARDPGDGEWPHE